MRCKICRKKIRLAQEFTCKCGDVFCTTHRLPFDHACKYDYHAEQREYLHERNPLVKSIKVSMI